VAPGSMLSTFRDIITNTPSFSEIFIIIFDSWIWGQ